MESVTTRDTDNVCSAIEVVSADDTLTTHLDQSINRLEEISVRRCTSHRSPPSPKDPTLSNPTEETLAVTKQIN